MPGPVFLRGESITLRTIEEEDVEFMRDTVNDPAIREGLLTTRPFNGEQEREYFEEQISDHETVNLMICEGGEVRSTSEGASEQATRDAEPAGIIGLKDIDQQAGNCEIGIWLATDYHGKGYGTEASRLLTGYAFDELRMHRVLARVLASNEASRRVWEKLGFEEEGVHRDEAFKGGEYVDVHYYGVLADEWER